MKKHTIKYILFGLGILLPTLSAAQARKTELSDTLKTEIRAFGQSVPVKTSTASISTVSGTTVRGINTPNIGNTFAGQLSGLSVSQTGSAPGNQDWPWLMIRGKGSFLGDGGGDIKVVVDGFETKWNNIIPDEIESISVLKDAAALAMYGMDGANGVLYIKTKKGHQREKNRITFNARFSLQQPTIMPNYVNNGEYAMLYNEALKSDGKDISSGIFRNDYIVRYYKEGTHPYLFADVDWVGAITMPQTYAHDYTLSVNGGSKAVVYNVLLGYMNTQGIYAGTDPKRNTSSNWDLRRYTVRTNLDVEITKHIRSEVSLRATIDDKTRPNTDEGTLWKNMGLFIPYSVKTENGEWSGAQNYSENPVAAIQAKGYNSDNDRTIDANVKLIGNLSPFVDGLEAFGQVVFSNNYLSSYNKTRAFPYVEYISSVDLLGFVDYSTVERGTSDNNYTISQPSGVQWNRYNVLAGLTYSNHINNGHRVHAAAMYTQELYRTAGNNMPRAKMGVVGRAGYSCLDKYIAEFGYSFIGSGEYAPGNRFGFFPSLSGAWILSEEDFLKESQHLDFLKLSTSFGLIGNDRMGSGSRFTFKQYYMGSGVGYHTGNGFNTTTWAKKQGSLANPDVTWEKSYKFNVALTATAFKSLDMKVEYFFDHRTDIFVTPSSYMSALIGADYYNMNAGVANNQGFEIELSYHNKIGQFGYFVAGRFSYAKNKVVDMKESPKAEDYLYLRGNPIDQPMVLEAIGFFKDEQDILDSPLQMFGTVQPGDVKYKNQNNDNVIDDNDRVPLGNPTYPRFHYGTDLGVSYKGFDLSVFVQGVGGRTVSLLSSGFMTPFVNSGVKPHPELAANYWTAERMEAALYPRLTTESNNNNYRASTLWQVDGSYIRIKNIELGYTFPTGFVAGITGVRLYVNMVNPFTISALNKFDVDPEINSPYKYPLMKSSNFGVSLQF